MSLHASFTEKNTTVSLEEKILNIGANISPKNYSSARNELSVLKTENEAKLTNEHRNLFTIFEAKALIAWAQSTYGDAHWHYLAGHAKHELDSVYSDLKNFEHQNLADNFYEEIKTLETEHANDEDHPFGMRFNPEIYTPK